MASTEDHEVTVRSTQNENQVLSVEVQAAPEDVWLRVCAWQDELVETP
jgi:hypothetical protein